jgi:ABC-type nitrate/sulfonate/bicarbonate transport system permease component
VSSITSNATNRLLTRRRGRSAAGWVLVAACAITWQIVGSKHTYFFLPSVTSILGRVFSMLTGQALASNIIPSISRATIALAISCIAGIALGLVIGTARWLDPWVRPALEFLRSVPAPVVIPLALIIVGFSNVALIAAISFGCIWPILINSLDGVRRIDPLLVDVARTSGYGRLRILFKVVLPASLPQTFPGLRIATAVSLVMMVLSEQVGASSGLGYQILYDEQSFRYTDMWAGVFLLSAVGLAFALILIWLERRLIWWSGARRDGDPNA